MPDKLRFWGCFIIVTLLCWIDYQYFSEGGHVRQFSEQKRQLAHLVLLLLVIPAGYAGWMKHPMQWTKRFWLLSYFSAVALLLMVGIIQFAFHLFNTEALDIISNIRLFFTSPMPYLVLFLLTKVVERMEVRN